jgi:hypothetical protein
VAFTSYGPDHSADAAIARQLEAILIKRYVPKPHTMLDDFQHRRFLSLATGVEQAVAHALDIEGSGAPGDIPTGGVKEIFLGGKDFAVAISREYIMSLFDSPLQGLRSMTIGFQVKVTVLDVKVLGRHITIDSTATYTVAITGATAQWAAGIINLHVTGQANADKVWAPDADFTIDQALALGFDASSESLTLAPSGSPSVWVNVHGPVGPLVESAAKSQVASPSPPSSTAHWPA